MANDSYTPESLFETLADLLRTVDLYVVPYHLLLSTVSFTPLDSDRSEIAVSPYILPEDTEEEHDTTASTSTGVSKNWTSSSIRPFALFEGDKLVIPQKPLYALFGYAIKVLSGYPRDILQVLKPDQAKKDSNRDVEGIETSYEDSFQQIDDLTKCIILQNPEHTKALNLRKRLLLYKITKINSQNRTTGIIQAELSFAKLTLGIAANAKMGTLWHHRKWLYALQYESEQHESVTCGHTGRLNRYSLGKNIYRIEPVPLPINEMQHELDLINTCAERYPRNYHAWAYRCWIIKGQLVSLSSHPKSDDLQLHTEKDRPPILTQEYEAMEHRLSTHIGDHTSAVHLLNILTLAVQSSYDGLGAGQLGERLLDMARKFAMDFVTRYPYKETPWLLLRGVLDIQNTFVTCYRREIEEVEDESLQQAIFLAINIRDAEVHARDRGSMENENNGISDYEEQQTIAARKYATRTLFYVSCRYNGAGHPSLGSDDARKVLDESV